MNNEYGEGNYIEFNLFENELAKNTIENAKTSEDLLFRLSALTDKPKKKEKQLFF